MVVFLKIFFLLSLFAFYTFCLSIFVLYTLQNFILNKKMKIIFNLHFNFSINLLRQKCFLVRKQLPFVRGGQVFLSSFYAKQTQQHHKQGKKIQLKTLQ